MAKQLSEDTQHLQLLLLPSMLLLLLPTLLLSLLCYRSDT
jgi:hypothetical protein